MEDILSCVHALNSLGDKGHAAAELIKRYTKNILDNPTAAKYRRIRIENAKFNTVIWSLETGRNLMYALGFEQEGNDYLVLPEDVDLSLVKDVLLVESGVKPSVTSSVAPATQETAASVPSLRLGKSAKDQSYFDSVQADMTLLSYMVEMGYDREVGRRALIATGNKGVQPAMDWISANPQSHVVAPSSVGTSDNIPSEDVPVKSKTSTLPAVSRYESTAAERHAFQEKKRKEEILAAKIAKKEDIAAKKILLASVEAEKKLRQSEPETLPADQTEKEDHSKVDHPTVSKKHCEVAMIKLRMPDGKVSTLQLNPNDTVATLYQHASQVVGTTPTDIKLLSPSTLQEFADQDLSLEDAGLTPRGLIIVQILYHSEEDPR